MYSTEVQTAPSSLWTQMSENRIPSSYTAHIYRQYCFCNRGYREIPNWRCLCHVIAISYFAILRHTLRYKARAAETSRPFRGLPLWRGRLGVGCWIQHETLVGCMATSIYKGETDLLVTRYTLDTSCFSGPLSARSWSATTKLGRVFAFVSRLSSARRGKPARQSSPATCCLRLALPIILRGCAR